jgi:hypothetical protein
LAERLPRSAGRARYGAVVPCPLPVVFAGPVGGVALVVVVEVAVVVVESLAGAESRVCERGPAGGL